MLVTRGGGADAPDVVHAYTVSIRQIVRMVDWSQDAVANCRHQDSDSAAQRRPRGGQHGYPPPGLPLPATLFGRAVFYGWYIVAVACLVSMMSMGISAYGLGVFITPMTEDLGWSRTDISLGRTLSTGAMGFVGLTVGGLDDRRGGRALIVFGSGVAGSAYILLRQVQELWQYYLITGAALTIGMGTMGTMGTIVLNVIVSN